MNLKLGLALALATSLVVPAHSQDAAQPSPFRIVCNVKGPRGQNLEPMRFLIDEAAQMVDYERARFGHLMINWQRQIPGHTFHISLHRETGEILANYLGSADIFLTGSCERDTTSGVRKF